MRIERFPLLASSNFALLLAACGGGGGSEAPPATGNSATPQPSSASESSPALLRPGLQTATARHLYVSPDGSDANPGTQTAPFRTLQKGADAAQPDSTIHVAPGTYAENLRIRNSGEEAARIYFVSDQPGGARIVPASGRPGGSAMSIAGDHVTVNGFEIDGSTNAGGARWRIGIASNASNVSIENNYIHHIATQADDCSNNGGGGVVGDGSAAGKNVSISYNHVHDIGPATSCNFIHGIYMSTTGTVSHNLVYRVAYAGVHLWHDADRVNVLNNTIFNTARAILVGAGERYHLDAPGDFFNVADNILVDNEYGIAEVSDGAGHGTHNRYSGNVQFRNRVNEALYQENSRSVSGTVAADPEFVDYRKEGGGNYRLKADSPATGKGAWQ